jgi:hypothetical protein
MKDGWSSPLSPLPTSLTDVELEKFTARFAISVSSEACFEQCSYLDSIRNNLK